MENEFELKVTKVSQAAAALPDFIVDETASYLLYVRDTVVNGIRQYCGRDSNRELGGILLGRRFQTGDRHLVEVLDFRPLLSSDRSRTHFTFEQAALLDVWGKPLPEGMERIGWFHSHPKLGDPFMSTDDLALHKSYFPAPWYVSCVVATGEWALPLGFWRVARDQLLAIGSHYVLMSHASPIGEQSRRFLRSCRPEVSIDAALSELKLAFEDLDAKDSDIALELLRVLIDSDIRPGVQLVSAEGLGTLLKLGVSTAARMKDGLDIEPLVRRLNRFRDMERSLTTAIQSIHLVGQLIVTDQKCLTFNQGGQEVCKGDFTENTVVPLRLQHPSQIVNGAMSSDGKLYVLMQDGCLIRFMNPSSNTMMLSGTGESPCKGSIKAADGTSPLQVMVDGAYVFARFPVGVCRLELAAVMESFSSTVTLSPIIAAPADGDLRLIEGMFACSGASILRRGQDLQVIGGNGEVLATGSLEPGLAKATLVQACKTQSDIALLFNRDGVAALEILDATSLEPRLSYRSKSESKWQSFTCIASDLAGRLFLKNGGTVFRVL